MSFKVDNAIILAAGMATRFAPLSYEKPKGLLAVKGEVLIERQIRQLHEAGITDITIVVGYLGEQFSYLKEKFGVDIVVNEDYYRYNNASSLIRVLDRLKNTYICSSDNYFTRNVFEPIVKDSYYSVVYADGETDEWCVQMDESGIIKSVQVGGRDSWYMLGHVFFSEELSKKFCKILKAEYESEETRQNLWEKLYIKHINELPLYTRKYGANEIREFDSLEELRAFDEKYVNNTESCIFANIRSFLKCSDKDISDVMAMESDDPFICFSFLFKGEKYIYRHPLKIDGYLIDLENIGWNINVFNG